MAEPIKHIFNADAQEKDLSVFKNIESLYSPIPPRLDGTSLAE